MRPIAGKAGRTDAERWHFENHRDGEQKSEDPADNAVDDFHNRSSEVAGQQAVAERNGKSHANHYGHRHVDGEAHLQSIRTDHAGDQGQHSHDPHQHSEDQASGDTADRSRFGAH